MDNNGRKEPIVDGKLKQIYGGLNSLFILHITFYILKVVIRPNYNRKSTTILLFSSYKMCYK